MPPRIPRKWPAAFKEIPTSVSIEVISSSYVGGHFSKKRVIEKAMFDPEPPTSFTPLEPTENPSHEDTKHPGKPVSVSASSSH